MIPLAARPDLLVASGPEGWERGPYPASSQGLLQVDSTCRIVAASHQLGKVMLHTSQDLREDVIEVPALQEERRATLELFRTVHLGVDSAELARHLLVLVQRYSGCEAVAIRLRQGPDFPYAASHGFPQPFLHLENHLCTLDEAGKVVRDEHGNPLLECMCGNVLAGRIDPSAPYFTHSSFFTNSTTELLASTTPEQRQGRTRNRCHGAGHESVALIPIRLATSVFGLFQCNDRRRDRFTPETIATLEDLAASAAHLFQLSML